MSWNFGSWLRQHEVEIKARWLAVVQEPPAYVVLPPDERLSCWHSLVEALLAEQAETLATGVQQWADREMRERGATPSELLSIAKGLSQAIRDLLPAEGSPLGQVNGHLGRLNALDAALVTYFAGEAERLAADKSQLETLYEITRELTASLDLGRMLHRTLAEVITASTGEMGVVFLVDSEAGKVIPETAINWDSEGIPLAMLPSQWQLGQADASWS